MFLTLSAFSLSFATANMVKTRLRDTDTDLFEEHSHLFDADIGLTAYSALYADGCWRMTEKIYNEARRCHDSIPDKSAWMKVVNSFL